MKKSIMDSNFVSFCKEINNLREAVKCWEKKHKIEKRQNNKEIHKKFANTLVLALIASDLENRSLITKKNNKKLLADDSEKRF